jgi:hypothetical protein
VWVAKLTGSIHIDLFLSNLRMFRLFLDILAPFFCGHGRVHTFLRPVSIDTNFHLAKSHRHIPVSVVFVLHINSISVLAVDGVVLLNRIRIRSPIVVAPPSLASRARGYVR